MKTFIITFFTVLFCLTSSVGWSLEYKDLVYRDGIYYKKFSDVPFTGTFTGLIQCSIKNGKMEGSWVSYYENGQLESKGNYKNGKREGPYLHYFDTGRLFFKGNYKNDKREGVFEGYNGDGSIQYYFTGTFKNGKKVSD